MAIISANRGVPTSAAANGLILRPPRAGGGILAGVSFMFDAQASNLTKDTSNYVSQLNDLSGFARNATQGESG